MALSFVEYTADGVDTQFAVTFAFIAQSHVTVTIDGVDDATFTFINDGLIEPTNTPALNEKVRITRTTPTGPTSQTDFADGSTLVESDLDRVLQQAMFVAEESNDAAANSLNIADDDATVWDAETQRIKNVVDGTNDQDVVTKAQLDAISVVAGNVPTPSDPGDDNKYLKAGSALFAWTDFLIAHISDAAANIKTLLGTADFAAFRVSLGLGTAAVKTAPATTVDNNLPRFDGTAGNTQASGVTVDDDDNLFGHGGNIVADTGTALTLTAIHNGSIVTLDNASAITLTLPEDSTETIAAGFQCVLIAKGDGLVTVAKEGTDTILSKDSLLQLTKKGSVATVVKLTSGTPNAWFLGGDLIA